MEKGRTLEAVNKGQVTSVEHETCGETVRRYTRVFVHKEIG